MELSKDVCGRPVEIGVGSVLRNFICTTPPATAVSFGILSVRVFAEELADPPAPEFPGPPEPLFRPGPEPCAKINPTAARPPTTAEAKRILSTILRNTAEVVQRG